MPTCVYADDAYLVARFPAVVVRTPERWRVTVLAAEAGAYTVTLAGIPFAYPAVPADDIFAIAEGLEGVLSGQMLAAVSPVVGSASLLLDGATALSLDVTATGPTEGDIEAALLGGGDSNAAFRALWLEDTKCWMPPCCLFTCRTDFTLMHAAIAAHMILTYGSIGSTGTAANDFNSMRLGPASLTKGQSAWAAAAPGDGDLARTGPGQLYLQIRDRYVFGFKCV